MDLPAVPTLPATLPRPAPPGSTLQESSPDPVRTHNAGMEHVPHLLSFRVGVALVPAASGTGDPVPRLPALLPHFPWAQEKKQGEVPEEGADK